MKGDAGDPKKRNSCFWGAAFALLASQVLARKVQHALYSLDSLRELKLALR